MKRIMLLATLAIVAVLVAGCQDDKDEPVTESRQPSPQQVTTPEVTHEVTHVVEKTLPQTGGVKEAK